MPKTKKSSSITSSIKKIKETNYYTIKERKSKKKNTNVGCKAKMETIKIVEFLK